MAERCRHEPTRAQLMARGCVTICASRGCRTRAARRARLLLRRVAGGRARPATRHDHSVVCPAGRHVCRSGALRARHGIRQPRVHRGDCRSRRARPHQDHRRRHRAVHGAPRRRCAAAASRTGDDAQAVRFGFETYASGPGQPRHTHPSERSPDQGSGDRLPAPVCGEYALGGASGRRWYCSCWRRPSQRLFSRWGRHKAA